MKMDTLKAAAWAFVRVFAAAVAAAWVNDGMPMQDVTVDMMLGWAELGVQAGVALVMANYVGPWEKRYGIQRKAPTPVE